MTSNLTVWYVDKNGATLDMDGYAGNYFALPGSAGDTGAHMDIEDTDVFSMAWHLANVGRGLAAHELLKACYIGLDTEGAGIRWQIWDGESFHDGGEGVE